MWLWAKFKGYLAAAGVVIAALAAAYFKGRRGGIKDAKAEQAKETQRVQEKFDRIDAQRPDFDGAIGNLRKRSNQGNRKGGLTP